ncbi:MAG: PD-(D/E)XK nuclease family protein, partial [bacterium]|nr:PD-(D/E)XK nuclease family protein [bacterium]
LSFDQINGRQFDYVAVVDMVHGRIPKDLAANQVLDNSSRIFINNLMPTAVFSVNESFSFGGKSELLTFEELEQDRFFNAIKSASKGLLFTAAKQDQGGREQPKSEYFDAINDKVNFEVFIPSYNKIETKLAHAKHWLKTKEENQLLEQEIVALKLFSIIKEQRDRFTQKSESESILEVVGEYAFKSDASLFRNRFSRYLGLDPLKPLSGTRVESLARCRFSGFVESMLKVETVQPDSGDIDARILGKLAHKVLEVFYANNKRLSPGKINKTHREQISTLLYKYGEFYLSKAVSGHQAVLWAYVQWLETALFRLVSNLANNPPIENVVPQAMEMAVGVGGGKDKRLDSMPLSWDDETLYFGGIIDRFDEGESSRVVVDYKLSSAAAISRNVEEKRVFHSHFQLPLYLKLLEYHYPTTEKINLFGYLVSISDGAISPVLGLNRIKDFKRRIKNDIDPDSLLSGLKELINPVLQGAFPADISDRCDACKFKRVCRVSLKESA